MKSLEELKAEALATQQALETKLAEQRQAIRDAEALVKQQKALAQLEIARKESEVKAQALVSALQAAGYTDASYSFDEAGKWDEYPVIKFTGCGYATEVKFEQVRTAIGFRYRTTGHKIVIGGYGGKTFPQKKDGSFSYDKIAAAVREIHASRTAKAVQENKEHARHEANKIIKARVCMAFGLSEYTSAVVPAKYVDNKVTVKLELTLDESQATQLLQAVRDMGLDIH